MAYEQVFESTQGLDEGLAQTYRFQLIERDRSAGRLVRYWVQIDRSYPGQSRIHADLWATGWQEMILVFGEDPRVLEIVAPEQKPDRPWGLRRKIALSIVAELLRPAMKGAVGRDG